MCLEGLLFDLQPEHWQLWETFLVVFLSLLMQMVQYYFFYSMTTFKLFPVYHAPVVMPLTVYSVRYWQNLKIRWILRELSSSCSMECRRAVAGTCTWNFWGGLAFTPAIFCGIWSLQPNVGVVSWSVLLLFCMLLNFIESVNSNKNHNEYLWQIIILFYHMCASLLAVFYF